jgi:hypothetical protein
MLASACSPMMSAILDRYLHGGDVDPARDLVGYRQAALHLSDPEIQEFLADLVAVIRPRLEYRPSISGSAYDGTPMPSHARCASFPTRSRDPRS